MQIKQDLNLSVFNMISCKCKCKFDGTKCKSNQWCVKPIYVKNIMFGILLHVIVKMEYIQQVLDDSAIIFDEVIESYGGKIKTILTNFNEKKET